MFDVQYLNNLRAKYNYDDKTMRALGKIIPCLIDYYGDSYEEHILSAIFDARIISCNSYQTISKFRSENKLTKIVGQSEIGSIDIKSNEGVYLSDVKISYNEFTNSYNIDEISRLIVTAHSFNYDSPKGLEVLVYLLVKLIKSYENEYTIDENVITKRSGISSETRNIMNDKNEIYLDFDSDKFKGLQEGFNIYDTGEIVSLILSDKYQCYDYDSILTVASIIKNKFGLGEQVNRFEITGDIDGLYKIYPNGIDDLALKCDECLLLENEMFISMFREEKNELAKTINKKLSVDIFKKLMDLYEFRSKIKT